jgi:hypothetical protein
MAKPTKAPQKARNFDFAACSTTQVEAGQSHMTATHATTGIGTGTNPNPTRSKLPDFVAKIAIFGQMRLPCRHEG